MSINANTNQNPCETDGNSVCAFPDSRWNHPTRPLLAVVFDGIGEGGYRRSFAALKSGGLLCAYGYSAGVQAQGRMLTMLMWIARLYLWRWLPSGKRAQFYSINIMRARHPGWFRDDLEQLFSLLATRSIQPRIAERLSFDGVLTHRRLEKGGLEGKLVLCPESPLGHAA
jgi:NADPH:quinone reductase-like Zn-dependent oxidoreductase